MPNTAHAKLNVAMSRPEVLAQGLSYAVDSLVTDPLVLPVAVLACAVAFGSARRSRPLLSCGIGIAAYVAYLCWIGGDFMSGRFFAAPFLLAVLVLSTLVREQPAGASMVAALALVGGPLPGQDNDHRRPAIRIGSMPESPCSFCPHTYLHVQNVLCSTHVMTGNNPSGEL